MACTVNARLQPVPFGSRHDRRREREVRSGRANTARCSKSRARRGSLPDATAHLLHRLAGHQTRSAWTRALRDAAPPIDEPAPPAARGTAGSSAGAPPRAPRIAARYWAPRQLVSPAPPSERLAARRRRVGATRARRGPSGRSARAYVAARWAFGPRPATGRSSADRAVAATPPAPSRPLSSPRSTAARSCGARRSADGIPRELDEDVVVCCSPARRRPVAARRPSTCPARRLMPPTNATSSGVSGVDQPCSSGDGRTVGHGGPNARGGALCRAREPRVPRQRPGKCPSRAGHLASSVGLVPDERAHVEPARRSARRARRTRVARPSGSRASRSTNAIVTQTRGARALPPG